MTQESESLELMDPIMIRNTAVIGSARSGKGILVDSLAPNDSIRVTDSAVTDAGSHSLNSPCRPVLYDRPEEAHVEVPTSGHEDEEDEDEGPPSHRYLVNLLCLHEDPKSEGSFESQLRVTDGALVVVDCVEGVSRRTATVLRQALSERIRPVLHVNKVDRALLELQLDPEEAYQAFHKSISNVNVVIATYNDPLLGDLQVMPEMGTVSFGSGLHGWAFSLAKFGRMYSAKFGIEAPKLMKKFWGDNFYDGDEWKEEAPDADSRRAFVQFCLDPIYTLFDAVMKEKTEKTEKMLKSLNIQLKAEEKDQPPKRVLKAIMQKFLPAADALLEMLVIHLPSPKKAQAYRAEMLYSAPQKDVDTGEQIEGQPDRYFKAIADCDQDGPLSLYISKMVPTADKGRFFAFGRVFSGRARTDGKVRILGSNYEMGRKTDLFENKGVTTFLTGTDGKATLVDNVLAGSLVCLVGVDQYIVKTATITDAGEENVYPFVTKKDSFSRSLFITVEVHNPCHLPKLMQGLKWLSKSDASIKCETAETGELVIHGISERHLASCIQDLQEFVGPDCPLLTTEAKVTHRETVTDLSSVVCMAKSPNKHNRLYSRAEPIAEELCDLIEQVPATWGAKAEDPKQRGKGYERDFDWDPCDARKIWCFGPNADGPNVLVDTTKGVQNLVEIKDSLNAAFQIASAMGPLAEEAMRGVRLNLEDVVLFADCIHRGAGQIIPTFRRNIYGSCLSAKPRLMEPVWLLETAAVHEDAISPIASILEQARGEVLEVVQRGGTSLYGVVGYLPAAHSSAVCRELEDLDCNCAPTFRLDHWIHVDGDPLDPDSTAGCLVYDIRKRKGMRLPALTLDAFLDKL
jgi:elongation factor 2